MKLNDIYTRHFLKILFVSILFITSCSDNILPGSLAGTYTGKERIIIRYNKDGQYIFRDDVVLVSLFMDSLGHVAGMVGEAELQDCNVTRNRGWIGQHLGFKTDFKLSGMLKGYTFDKDTILNKNISMPFNIENGDLRGSLFLTSTGQDSPIISNFILRKGKD